MGYLSSLFAQSSDRSPSSDYWYQPIGSISRSGVQVSEDQVLRISAVLQGVRFVCQTVAGLPRFIYQTMEDGRSREKVRGHPLSRILRYLPNPWQTSFQFFEQMIAHAMLRGYGNAEKVYDGNTLVALVPLNPDRLVKVEQLTTGKLRYVYRGNNGSPRTLLQDDVFSLCGFGIDGIRGLSMVDQMRETAGLALATEAYGSSFFAHSAMPRVVLQSKHEINDPNIRQRMKEDWNDAYGGDRQHGTALLEQETDVKILSTKNNEAQFIETRRFLIAEFSRFMDVTPHRLSDMEKTSYNNVEQMAIETVVYGLQSWVRRLEQTAYRDLLTEEDRDADRFIEFSMDGLLRGDTEARASFYQSGVHTGWLTRNEVREKENYNPIDGLDEPLQAVNQQPVGQEQAGRQQRDGANGSPTQRGGGRAAAIARAAAERVLRREQLAMKKWRERTTDDDAEWKKQVDSFYHDHVGFVAEAMAIERDRAERWCALQRSLVFSNGGPAVDISEDGDEWMRENMIAILVREALQ